MTDNEHAHTLSSEKNSSVKSSISVNIMSGGNAMMDSGIATRRRSSSSQQERRNSENNNCLLTAKPHAFGGAVLAPKHARELTPSLALAMAHTLGDYVMNISEKKVQYTEWITEAWSVLGWAEPSASLFWEMATMYHTLHVAGREAVIHSSNTTNNSHGQSKNSPKAHSKSPSHTSQNEQQQQQQQTIPPILSCDSNQSVESANNNSNSSNRLSSCPVSPPDSNSKNINNSSSNNNNKCNAASAKELPVWLLGMFLLLHCEEQAFLRNVSGEDERRFDARMSPGGSSSNFPYNAGRSSNSNNAAPDSWLGGDFSNLLTHPSISPRTRIHAGQFTDNCHCTAFLLRHLRKFLLLTAVPHNLDAHWALYQLAQSENDSQNEYAERKSHRHHGSNTIAPASPTRLDSNSNNINSSNNNSILGQSSSAQMSSGHTLDPNELLFRHTVDHAEFGSHIELTSNDLERLNFLLQSPSGGFIDDPPLCISDIVMDKCIKSMNQTNSSILLHDAEAVIRKHLELELLHGHNNNHDLNDNDQRQEGEASNSNVAAASLSKLSLSNDSDDDSNDLNDASSSSSADPSNKTDSKMGRSVADEKETKQEFHKELSYTHMRSTTILLKPNSYPENASSELQQPMSSSYNCSSNASTDFFVASSTNGRLHDLHVSDCSDAHMYLLQPFEHATISACTDCTIVIGAVAGLLHVVDCERTVITVAARRVLVSNCFNVLHCVFTPSPPLLVGDNRSCQFAPYNTYYDGIREDLIATGLAAVLVTPDFPFDNCQKSPALQCASNKWKGPVELAKLEVPLPLTSSVVPSSPTSSSAGSVGADDKALTANRPGGGNDDAMKTPVHLPPSEFHVLFVPLESEAAKLRRSQNDTNNSCSEDMMLQMTGTEDNSLLPSAPSGAANKAPLESAYCRNLSDVLQNTPFRLPTEYERRVLMKVDRIRTIQHMIQNDLTPEQQWKLENELNQGFRDWLVTSGNLRQVLDLVHMEKKEDPSKGEME